jgi:diguanylate cyclase (GGDEF)-like protein/PAS domain S-box-containing protein
MGFMQATFNTMFAVIDQHVAATFVLNRDGRVIVWNRACAKLTGLPAEAVLGTADHWKGFYDSERLCVADLVLNDAIERAPEYYVAYSDSQTAVEALVVELWCDIRRTGRRIYIAAEAGPIHGPDGQLIAVIESIRDLTHIKAAEARLRDLAGLDGLTGLPNRRTFDETLASEWRRSVRSGEPISLLLIDVDHFNAFNDNLGHGNGDQCLAAVAGVIANSLRRAGDVPARYGGEEFAIILPSTDAAGAEAAAENVRQAIERKGIRHPASPAGPFVTASIGCATARPGQRCRSEELFHRADAALYRAKSLGRNRACADPSECASESAQCFRNPAEACSARCDRA